eukprot:1825741-Pyramimonas_sp.AAC.1
MQSVRLRRGAICELFCGGLSVVFVRDNVMTDVVSSDAVILDVCSSVLEGAIVSCDSVALSDGAIRFPEAGGADGTGGKPRPSQTAPI